LGRSECFHLGTFLISLQAHAPRPFVHPPIPPPTAYNYLPPWDNAAVADAMCKNIPGGKYRAVRVATVEEAEAAIQEAKALTDHFVFIEVMVSKHDAAPGGLVCGGSGGVGRGWSGGFGSAILLLLLLVLMALLVVAHPAACAVSLLSTQPIPNLHPTHPQPPPNPSPNLPPTPPPHPIHPQAPA